MSPNYIRKPIKATCRGLGLRHPPDLLPDGLYPILNNMEQSQLGALTVRAGIAPLNAIQYPAAIHSIRRLNDPTNSTFARFVGAGTALYDTTSNTPIDTGYSGSPLALLPFRPNQSPSPWMYVFDSSRSRKVRTDRTNYAVGIAPALQPPLVARGQPNLTAIDEFGATGSWANKGDAGAISVPKRINTIITAILYDSGTTGWSSVVPAAIDSNFQPGAFVLVNSGAEISPIRQVFAPIANSTIASILYDSGSVGYCSIVLATQSTGLQNDAVVKLGTAEYVRVLSTSTAPDGTVSFRCFTVFPHLTGESVTGVGSFRIYFGGTYAPGIDIVSNAFLSTFTFSSGKGWLYLNTSGSPIDLSNVNGRPTQNSDYLHISLMVDNPAALTQGRIILNLDPAFPDTTSGTFPDLRNALYKDFGPSNFQGSVDNTLTDFAAQQQAIQTGLVNDSTASMDQSPQQLTVDLGAPTGGIVTDPSASPIPDQTIPGVSLGTSLAAGAIWTELHFPLSEMTQVGSSQISSLKSVTGLIIQLVTTGTVNFFVSSWWLGGTYGPDSGGGTPYTIYQRYRSTATGARSNPSPPLRAPLDLQRERGVITPVPSPDPQTDTIDLFAQGGGLTLPRKIASVPNAAVPFNWDSTDSANLNNEQLDFTLFQPFPVTDLPRSGTCVVSGTSVQFISGDQFNTSWQTGSIIIINNIPYTLYASPQSNTRLELIENAGAFTSPVAFSIPEATLAGIPVRSVWGPDPITGVMFGCNNTSEPGTLYWTNPNDPDTASDANNLPITSGSEILQCGFMYDGRSYVYSNLQLYYLYPSQTTNPQTGASILTYVAQAVPNAKGIFGPYALAVGDDYFAMQRAGVDEHGDSNNGSITDETLYPLFPSGGSIGTSVNGYSAIDPNQPDSIRLFYTRRGIWFMYNDVNHIPQVFRYNRTIPEPGWFPRQYTPAPGCFYEEEGVALYSELMGGSDGIVYRMGVGHSDNSLPINYSFQTASPDLGDERLQKLFLDAMLDVDQMGNTINWAAIVNKGTQTLTSLLTTGTTGRAQIQLPLTTNPLALYLDCAMACSGQTTSASPIFYQFEINAVLQPLLALNMSSPNYLSHGFTTYGHLRDGYFTWISTTPVTVTILTDIGLTYTFQLPSSNGVVAKQYVPLAPLKGLLFYYSTVSNSPFAIFTDETIVHAKEWGNNGSFIPFKPWQGQSA